MNETPTNEMTERLLRLLKDRGRLSPFAPWHLVAYEKAAGEGLAELAGGDIVLTPKGRRAARSIFGRPVSGPEGPTGLPAHWRNRRRA